MLCFCFVLCFGDDMVTVHRTTYRSFTSSLLRPLNRRRPTYQLIQLAACNKHVERPGKSHEGVGRKKRHGSLACIGREAGVLVAQWVGRRA